MRSQSCPQFSVSGPSLGSSPPAGHRGVDGAAAAALRLSTSCTLRLACGGQWQALGVRLPVGGPQLGGGVRCPAQPPRPPAPAPRAPRQFASCRVSRCRRRRGRGPCSAPHYAGLRQPVVGSRCEAGLCGTLTRYATACQRGKHTCGLGYRFRCVHGCGVAMC